MIASWLTGLIALTAGSLLGMGILEGPTQLVDGAAMLQFERAADSYAFLHRQVERRGSPARTLAEGGFFTPVVAAAFRRRIASVLNRDCQVPGSTTFQVPGVNTSAEGTPPLPGCVTRALPPLPEELAYRGAGVALLLIDAHLNIVVDVLHAAYGQRDNFED